MDWTPCGPGFDSRRLHRFSQGFRVLSTTVPHGCPDRLVEAVPGSARSNAFAAPDRLQLVGRASRNLSGVTVSVVSRDFGMTKLRGLVGGVLCGSLLYLG